MIKKRNILFWFFYIPQLYFLFKFSNYTSYGYLVVFLLTFPIYLITQLLVEHIEDSLRKGFSYFVKDSTICLLLSAFVYISIFKRWVDTNYLRSYILSFSRFVTVFVFTYSISHYLIKVSLHNYSNKPKLYILAIYAFPSIVVTTLLWLASYPVIMSPDSIYVWTSAVRNTYGNSHPLLYMLQIKLLSLIWQSPQIVMIFQIILTSFTLAYILYRVRLWGANKYICAALAIILPLFPVNSIFAVTMWKDIPYTMGLILISTELIRAIKEDDYYKKKKNIIFFIVLVLFTMTTRHNAPYVLIFSLLTFSCILLVKKMKKQSLINAIVAIACLITFYASVGIIQQLLGDNYVKIDASSSFYALPLQGIMAAYKDANDEVTKSQLERMDKYLNMDELEKHYINFEGNERWRNFSRSTLIIDKEAVKNDKIGFFALYFDFLKQNPIIVARSYFNQTALIWCSRDTSYVSGMPWYIANTEGYVYIKPDSKIPWLSEKVEDFLYANPKGIRAFFEHPASMMLLIVILAYVGIKKKGIKSIVFILPTIFNSLGYMASIEGQCTRYTYINYTIAIIYFIYVLLDEKPNTKIIEEIKEN